MNVQRVSHIHPAGAVQRTPTNRETGTVSMGTPAPVTRPKADLAPQTTPTPRVSHGVEASLSKLKFGG